MGFAAVSVAFLLIALVPVFRGGPVNATFLALGVVFFVLSLVGRPRRPPDSPLPPGD